MGPTELPLGPEPSVESSGGYIPTALGAALGGVGWIAGGALGGAYADRFMPGAGLGAMAPIFIVGIVSLWLSACFGVWVGLRLTRSEAVGPTVFLTAAGIPAWIIVSLPSLFWLPGNLGPLSPPVEMGIALLILCIPPALAARALVLHQKKLAEREEK